MFTPENALIFVVVLVIRVFSCLMDIQDVPVLVAST